MKRNVFVFLLHVFVTLLLVACAGEEKPIATVVSPAEDTIEVAVAATVEAMSVTEKPNISEPTPTVEPTVTIEPTSTIDPTPTVEPTSTTEPTPTVEPTPSPLCFGEEDEFAKYQKDFGKIEGSFIDGSINEYRIDHESAYVRELITQIEMLSPPSCMIEWQEGILTRWDIWADWVETTNDQTTYSFETELAYVKYNYEKWKLLYHIGAQRNAAELAVYGEAEPRIEVLYLDMHEGEFTSDNFTISEHCDDMLFDWVAIQGNDGGYVNIELVNYDTGDVYTIVNRVLERRKERHDNEKLKDIPAGEYFIRSTTFPAWTTVLRCEREWE